MSEPCEIAFLDVGNADCIVISPPSAPVFVVDVPKPTYLRNWLEAHKYTNIAVLYVTHVHCDHVPTLDKLVAFIEAWRKHNSLRTLCIPREMITKVITNFRNDPASNSRQNKVKHSLGVLSNMANRNFFTITNAEVTGSTEKSENLEIEIIHPTMPFAAQHSDAYPDRYNERSLVLRVTYAEFSALLTADIEEEGLEELLRHCAGDDSAFKCNVLKIPHHGAWQKDESTYRQFLDKADPEIAILSVGSRNIHKHVAPDLFLELIRRQKEPTLKLEVFVCTEVTRTCMLAVTDPQWGSKSGLRTVVPCAGDTVIKAEESGRWVMERRREHLKYVEERVPFPACFDRIHMQNQGQLSKLANNKSQREVRLHELKAIPAKSSRQKKRA